MNKVKLIGGIVAIASLGCLCKAKEDKLLDFARNNTPIYSYYRKAGLKEAKSLGIKGCLKQDAFLHGFTSAKLTYDFNPELVKLMGNFNELARPNNPIKDKFMDIYNNKKGIEIGKKLKNKGISIDNLSQIIKDSLDKGCFITDTTKLLISKR